jgi:hypothetical protein
VLNVRALFSYARALERCELLLVNMDNLGSHMNDVLYLGVLIRSSLEEFANICTYIYTVSPLTANKKGDI